MAGTEPTSVEAYLTALPEPAQAILRQVRAALLSALPGAEEVISYQIPALRLERRVVLYFAGWKQHFSLYPVSGLEALADELAPYVAGKGTLRFALAEPVPVALLGRIAQLRAAALRKQAADARPAKRRAKAL